MATDNVKINVFNPLSLLNTVGQEISELLENHSKDKDDFLQFMKWENLASIKKICQRDLKKIDIFFGIKISGYLKTFQEDYLVEEKRILCEYKKSTKIFNNVKSVLPLLRQEFYNGIDLLEDIANFFGVENEENILKQASQTCPVLFRKNTNFSIDQVNLYAWLRRGELDFQASNVTNYHKDKILEWVKSSVWKEKLDDILYFKALPDLFKTFGVALIYTPTLPKVVYGAVRWFNGIPLIQISDRDKDLATCWFTLFHEIGHVVLHENENIFDNDINNPKVNINQKEKEANKFANEYLYDGDDLRKYIFSLNKTFSNRFLPVNSITNFNVNPMFIAYWLKKTRIKSDFKHYSKTINFLD